MRVLLCGGGTAGHVIPAIAMGEMIQKHFRNSVIAFAGRSGGDENRAYLKTGHRLYTVDILGISHSLSINNAKSFIKVLKSSRKATEVLKEFKPDLIIGTGGYVCYPFIRQGQRLGIPTMIHESNAYPGLVTRLLGKRCDCVMLNISETQNYLKRKDNVTVVGIPTLTEFNSVSKIEARRKLGIKAGELLIVSFGGSLGSGALNETIPELIMRYTSKLPNVRHVHSTGRANYDDIKKRFPSLFSADNRVKIVPYIENMPLLLTAADLAITRSGAITLAELSRSATPSILIPSPNVTANHQYKNAQYAKTLGMAEILEENELTPETVNSLISDFIKCPTKLEAMSRAAAYAYPNNAETSIIQLIGKLGLS